MLTILKRCALVAATLLVGLLAVLFWLQHAIDPLTAPALLLDRTFQVLTLALVPACPLVLKGGTRPFALLYVGVVGTLLGVSVTLTGAIRPPADPYALTLAIAATAAGVALAVHAGRRLPQMPSLAARVALGLAGATIPALQFWNSAAFLPARTEVTLSQRVAVAAVSHVAGETRVNVDYRAENPTDARVLVIIARLTLCWWSPTEEARYGNRDLTTLPNCRWYRPIGQRSWIAPNSTLAGSHAFTVPDGRPHVVAVARVAYARGDRLRIGPTAPDHDSSGTCFSTEPYRLEEESRLKSLAQQPKYLVYYKLFEDGGTNYAFDYGAGTDCRPGRAVLNGPAHLAEYFGVTEGRAVLDFWMPRRR